VVEVGAVVAEELTLSLAVAPVIGVVCAVIGVIIAIVGMFVGKPKPEPTTAEKFVKNQGQKFLDSLPMPPKDWNPSSEVKPKVPKVISVSAPISHQ
jgi:hypothetical protein